MRATSTDAVSSLLSSYHYTSSSSADLSLPQLDLLLSESYFPSNTQSSQSLDCSLEPKIDAVLSSTPDRPASDSNAIANSNSVSATQSALKALTWRTVASLDTLIISYFQTGSWGLGLKIGVFELATKSILFCLHDQLWEKFASKNTPGISLLRAFSWRVVGCLDTILISTFLSGSLAIGGKIALVEFLSKTGLFYVHERIWERRRQGQKDKTS